jgi:hypothetical protein
MFIRQVMKTVAVTLSLALMSQVAMADYGTKIHQGKWDKKHPRQAEVNGRLQNQENRVKEGEQDGQLTKQEGKQVMGQDRRIFRQEQKMKARNGGDYLTKGQQEKINKEENGVSQEIKKDETTNSAAGN